MGNLMRERFWIACLVVLFVAGCSKMEDYVASERTAIERYLSGQKIYDRAEADDNPTGEVRRYYDYQNGVYKFTANESRLDRPEEIAEVGDSVTFYFLAYTFGSSPGSLFWTNRAYAIEQYMPNLNPAYWSTDPLRVKVGDGSILKGMENALPNSREGDSIAVFMTADLAYGKKQNGVVPAYTALMVVLSIEKITKNSSER